MRRSRSGVHQTVRWLRSGLDKLDRRKRPDRRKPVDGGVDRRTTADGSKTPDRRNATDGLTTSYAPRPDGLPDPGEVVWTWVAYEDDPARGKDRPVLLIARDGKRLVGLMLTSKDHDRDAADEARWGRYWMDVGPGAWDRRRRPSEVRLDRLIEIDPGDVRREGAALDKATFRLVIKAARRFHDLGEDGSGDSVG